MLLLPEKDFGGFLDNAFLALDLVRNNHHGHQLKDRSEIFKAVNTLSSTRFSINVDLLNYINSAEGAFLLDEKLDESNDL